MSAQTLRSKTLLLASLIVVLVVMALPGLAPAGAESLPTASPWRTAAPASQGVDPSQLAQAVALIERSLPKVFSLLVVKNGFLVFERYFREGRVDKRAEVYSVTKSVLSACVGIALERGLIMDLNTRVHRYFPQYFKKPMDPRKRRITLRHLLTMTAGQLWGRPGETGELFRKWYSSSNWVAASIALPQVAEPGTRFKYSGPVSHILSAVLTKAAGMNANQFANQHLFPYLGIKDTVWLIDVHGNSHGGWGLKLSAREMAKFGYLYLRKGRWQGRQVVPAHWVAESTKSQVKTPFGYDYGFYWWLVPVDGAFSYRAWGLGGQFIVVVPQRDLVIVVTSDTKPPLATGTAYQPLFDKVAAAAGR